MLWLEHCQAVFMCVCVSVRNRQQYPAGLNLPQHSDTTQHSTAQGNRSPHPLLGLSLTWVSVSEHTHSHEHTHTDTHIKWLISEKARITSRQTWQTRQDPCPHNTPLCQPTQVNGPVASHEQPRIRPSQATLGLLSTPLSHLEQRASSNNGCKSNYDIKICVNCEM